MDNLERGDSSLVTVIIPVHNSDQYLSRALISIKRQTYPHVEAIVVMDNCTYECEKAVESLVSSFPNVRTMKTEGNKYGAAGARNLGIVNARGRYISFLDSDDSWEGNHLEASLSFMHEHACPFVYSDYYVSKDGRISTFKAPQSITYKQLLNGCNIGCLTVVYDRNFFSDALMPVMATKREDFAMWLNLLKKAPAYNVGAIGGTYYINRGSVSSNKFSLIKYQYRVYRRIEKLGVFPSLYHLFVTVLHKIFKKY